MSAVECADCGAVPIDLPDLADPELWFERGDDGVMRCKGCEAIQEADRRWKAGDW